MRGDHGNNYSVYKLTSVSGNFYIGITGRPVDRRFREHVSTAKMSKKRSRFHKALIRYGRNGFTVETLKSDLTKEQSQLEEVRLIEELKPAYNVTRGGGGRLGGGFSDAAREKFRRIHTGNKYCLGKKHSQETKDLLRTLGLSQKDEWLKRSHLGPASRKRPVYCLNDGLRYESASEAAAFYGIPKSQVIEVCLRSPRRVFAKGKIFRYEGDHLGGLPEVEKAKEEYKIRKSVSAQKLRRPVICLNDGMTFNSAKDAGIHYGLSRGFIQEICLGDKASRTGLRFVYGAVL